MPKRRTEETTVIRYKQKAYAIAKGLGLSDDIAKAKAEAQTNAWVNGRSAYGKLARYVRDKLIMETDVKPSQYGLIISMSMWLYKEVAVRGSMDFETAWNVAVKKWDIDKAFTKNDVAKIKDIIQSYVAPTY